MSITDLKFAIVVSEFNQEITDKLLEGALAHFGSQGVNAQAISIVRVPGAIEIPLTAKLLAKTKKYNAIVCLGAVIRGDTDHYDYVCQQVSYGCQKVMLKLDIPLIFGILTTQDMQQAYDRIGGKEGHKGIEAADAAIKMARLVSVITSKAV